MRNKNFTVQNVLEQKNISDFQEIFRSRKHVLQSISQRRMFYNILHSEILSRTLYERPRL